MIKIYSPFESEQLKYIVEVLIDERIGLQSSIIVDESLLGFILEYGQLKCELSACLWELSTGELNLNNFEPAKCINYLSLNKNLKIPVVGSSGNINLDELSVDIDIFGFCFFMLSRIEEIADTRLDCHQRISGKNSFAYLNSFLDVPVVDHYVFLLRDIIVKLGLALDCNLSYSPLISCDVDFPTEYYFDSFMLFFKKVLIKLFFDKDLFFSIDLIFRYIAKLLGVNYKDKFSDNLNYIMVKNEDVGNSVIFYFIPHNTSQFDSNCDFNSNYVVSMMKEIIRRGHRIGIHPGYEATVDYDVLKESFRRFREVYNELGGVQIHCRTHYLKWDPYNTPSQLEQERVNTDSSLGYADVSGFRCGTCHPFRLYDHKNKCITNVIEYPLICMDATLISKKYENIKSKSEILKRIMKLRNECERVNGFFTLLWHNSSFEKKLEKEIYSKVIMERSDGKDFIS